MHESKSVKLRPIVATSGAVGATERVKVSPLLWPLVAYLGIGTVLLFMVSQLEAVAFAIMPGHRAGRRWHEGFPGWMALYPATLPLLLLRVMVLLSVAMPARFLYWLWRAARRLGFALLDAWSFVQSVIARALRAAQARVKIIVAWMRTVLGQAMRAVRETADVTVRQVRAALSRWFSRREQS